jgi:hypothetical protein
MHILIRFPLISNRQFSLYLPNPSKGFHHVSERSETNYWVAIAQNEGAERTD